MRVLITGASGMVGSALATHLQALGDTVCRLGRGTPQSDSDIQWDPDTQTLDASRFEGFDVIYHLAGESIAEGRWTDAKKARIRDSRVNGTRLLCETLSKLESKPKKLVSASAIGYYGHRGDEVVDEDSKAGDGYLPEVSEAWEHATRPAADNGISVAIVRIGIVLDKSGGALAKMLLPFKMGVGGKVGPGTQFMSWITLEDLIGVLHHSALTEELTGPTNGVAEAVTNYDFTKALGRALRRPTIFPMPAFAARLAFGEMADALLLSSTRVKSNRLVESGYVFKHGEIGPALEALVR